MCDSGTDAGATGKGAKDVGKGVPDANLTDATDSPAAAQAAIVRNIDTSTLGTARKINLPFPTSSSCISHDGCSITFALTNGCMLAVSCQTLTMSALSPAITSKVQSLVFSADGEAVYFVNGDGVFGVWRPKEFHQRVYGGVLLS